MPTTANKVHTLPAPTWTQSDNDLLPKWMKYLQWQQSHYGDAEIDSLRADIGTYDDVITDYTEMAQRQKERQQELRHQLAELEATARLTDDQIMANYQELIASPHVIGTRIDSWGGLVILVDPIVEGAEDYDFGVFEIDTVAYINGHFQSPHLPVAAEMLYDRDNLRRMPRTTEHPRLRMAKFAVSHKVVTDLGAYNALTMVTEFVYNLQMLKQHYSAASYLTKKKEGRDLQIPWNGWQVADPVRALKRLVDSAALSVETRISEVKSRIQVIRENIESYQDIVRANRKSRRESEAALLKLVGAKEKKEIDMDEAVRGLAYVTHLPGVIAIRFGDDGVPILHVRTSVVREGRRYDLGDYELKLATEIAGFGTVLDVTRTRIPIGGSYEGGWHTYQNAFCFGNRNGEIIQCFSEGDITGAVALAIGAMNTIPKYDFYPTQFAQIANDAVWKNSHRRRPRRNARRRAINKAMGHAALKAATV